MVLTFSSLISPKLQIITKFTEFFPFYPKNNHNLKSIYIIKGMFVLAYFLVYELIFSLAYF